MSAAPTKYTRKTNFTTDALFNPVPSPVLVDAELNAIKTASDQTIDRLAEIQREDGKLRNNIVTADALSADIYAPIGDSVERAEAAADRAEEIKNDIESSVIPDNTVSTTKIVDNAVTTAKIANNAITTEKVQDGAITTDKLAANAVDNSKLPNEVVTTNKLADAAVTEDKIEAGAVTLDKITSAGSLGFRNRIINGDMRINQRGFNGNWSSIGNGVYGYDRWKRIDADTIAQIIEAGNFTPGATHTISGNNIETEQIVAPSSGNWTIIVPNTATRVQVEEGTVATPFEMRFSGQELALCQRYYEIGEATFVGNGSVANRYLYVPFKVWKRGVASVTRISNGPISGSTAGTVVFGATEHGFYFTNNASTNLVGGDWVADAEL